MLLPGLPAIWSSWCWNADYDVENIFAKKCLCQKLQTWKAALFAQSATTFLIPVFLLPTWWRNMRRKSTATIIAVIEFFTLFFRAYDPYNVPSQSKSGMTTRGNQQNPSLFLRPLIFTSRSLSWIFSQTRGTPRNLVGRTSTNVCKKIINTPPSKYLINNTITTIAPEPTSPSRHLCPQTKQFLRPGTGWKCRWRSPRCGWKTRLFNNLLINWTIEQLNDWTIEQYNEQLADTFFYLKNLRGR